VVGLRRLIDRFGNVAALAAAPAHEIGAVRGWRRAAGADVPHTIGSELAAARAQVRAARAGGLALFTWDDPDYPPALRHDPSGCAPVLFVEGRLPPQLMLPSDKLRSCALVGKRRASDGGVAFARDLARSAA